VLLAGDDFTLSAFPVWHRGADCYGYLFEERERRPFIPERAEALGIPQGPWRRDLVNGQVITLPDGRTIQPDEVLGPARPGTRFVHVGDVGRTEELLPYAQDADGLVIEATYMDLEAEMAQEFGHLTARKAAELAGRAGVKTLILTHISRRYRERDVLAEAQAVFPNTYVARDFDWFQIKRDAQAIRTTARDTGE
jgi:ribonuclease Z